VATYYLANGESGSIEPLFGSTFHKTEIQGLVEGEFQILDLLDKGVLVVNVRAFKGGTKKKMSRQQN